jgi:large subunit ribosomal protein L1
MGKIRVKSFGDQEEEKKAIRRSEKRAGEKEQKNSAKTTEEAAASTEIVSPELPIEEEKTEKKKKSKFTKQRDNFRSQNYLAKVVLIDPKQLYSISEGLKLLDQAHMAKFDETVELHINTLNPGVSGSMTLPNGTGKITKVVIADDAVIAEIEKGKINFDILVAHPSMMPKLAKVAKILGPRGLMPNPKNGTISPNPETIAKKYEGGLLNFKTESKAPIIHLSVGKLSLGAEKLEENITTALQAVKKSNISNVTLKSSMSPGIKLKA